MLWLLLLLLLAAPAVAAPIDPQVLAEINLLRTRPQVYAGFLKDERKYYEGLILRKPGRLPIRTHEGLAAVEEAISFLERQAPVGALLGSPGLALAAQDHVDDQGRTGQIGHGGSDRSTPAERCNRYGSANGVGENIAYGTETARDIVMQLVIDDNVKDRGHRTNFFHPQWAYAGSAFGTHPTIRTICVIDFAAQYTEDSARQARRPARGKPAAPAAAAASAPVLSSASPFQQARAAADAHFAASAAQDRPAWIATFTSRQKPFASSLWSQALQAGNGASYSYACMEKSRAPMLRFRYLRKTGSSVSPCFITLVQEGGRWLVEDVTY